MVVGLSLNQDRKMFACVSNWKFMSSIFKVIQPSGILDGSKAAEFRREISDSAANGTTILIDFQNVSFMDSSGLGALVLARKAVLAAGAQLCVCSLNNQVRMLFELTSMDQAFKVFTSQEEFKNNFS